MGLSVASSHKKQREQLERMAGHHAVQKPGKNVFLLESAKADQESVFDSRTQDQNLSQG
jgi:hypothetical protein